jgi:pyruvate dehydrogenase E2 component (dihydrolipoamide acetyltransferase)
VAKREGLHGIEQGTGDAPVVLLHGFGASHAAWNGVVPRLAGFRRTLALDLPGHGGSLHQAAVGAGKAAGLVLADLDRRGMGEVHFVGHSMGGAVALLCALRDAGRVRSLTLLAPGGLGEEINHRLLRRYAAAADERELTFVLEEFFGWNGPLPADLAATLVQERRVEGAAAALLAIFDTFVVDGSQKMIPRVELDRLTMPTKVLWGTQDRVLPTRQAHCLPGHIGVHVFEGVGHMLPYEIPGAVARLVLENTR